VDLLVLLIRVGRVRPLKLQAYKSALGENRQESPAESVHLSLKSTIKSGFALPFKKLV
jgi:hypothetical protein